jgi:hypothetical protein
MGVVPNGLPMGMYIYMNLSVFRVFPGFPQGTHGTKGTPLIRLSMFRGFPGFPQGTHGTMGTPPIRLVCSLPWHAKATEPLWH